MLVDELFSCASITFYVRRLHGMMLDASDEFRQNTNILNIM